MNASPAGFKCEPLHLISPASCARKKRHSDRTMRLNKKAFLTATAFTTTLWALYQSNTLAAEPAADLPSVTVTAPRPPDPKELADGSVPKFISAHARPAVVTGQLARWRDGICVTTSGLTPAFNTFISARITAIARSVGAPPPAAGQCKPNVVIMFTIEPDALIQDLAKRRPDLLGFHYSQQTAKIKTFSHPIQGWYVTATQGYRGELAIDDAMPIQQISAPLSDPVGQALQAGTVPAGRLGSHIATGRSSLIMNVIIVADTKKVAGYPVGSISDYLAMLVLSQTRSPEDCGKLPSILDLMVSQCGDEMKSDSLTAGDIAFLHALYKTDLREGYLLEESEIQNKMMRDFSSH